MCLYIAHCHVIFCMSPCLCTCVCAFILLWFFSLTIGKQIFACFTLSVSPCLFLLLLIWPLLMFNFFSPFYLKSLHYHCTLPSKNTIQISPLRSTGRLVSLLFTLLKPRPWQTGAVLRPHLARRLRPVPASLFKTPIPQCNLLILFAPHSPTPAAMLPCCLAPHAKLFHAACDSNILWNEHVLKKQ